MEKKYSIPQTLITCVSVSLGISWCTGLEGIYDNLLTEIYKNL